jgi:hypothetical protein
MRSITACILSIALGGTTVFAGEAPAPQRPETAEVAQVASPPGSTSSQQPGASALPVYQLPEVGKPRRRVGGGRRGLPQDQPEVVQLVPQHVGRTVSAQPKLYWYLSSVPSKDIRVELTLIDEESIEPVLDVPIDRPTEPGLHKIDLGKYGVKLSPGQDYQWSVALVVDPSQRSLDVVSTGWIRRVAPPADLKARLAASPENAAAIYASEGLWYDALDATAQLGASNDPRFQPHLTALLQQVDITLP